MFISEDGIKGQLSEYLEFEQAIFSVKLGVSLLHTTIHPFFIMFSFIMFSFFYLIICRLKVVKTVHLSPLR